MSKKTFSRIIERVYTAQVQHAKIIQKPGYYRLKITRSFLEWIAHPNDYIRNLFLKLLEFW